MTKTTTKPKEMKVELKSVSINHQLSEETCCFSATLWINGKKVGTCDNHGQGGPTDYHIADPKLRKEFEDYCKSLPPEKSQYFPEGLKMDAELFIDILVGKVEEEREIRRLCRNETLFRLRSRTYSQGEWTSIKVKFTPVVEQQLHYKYGKDLAEILNKRLVKDS